MTAMQKTLRPSLLRSPLWRWFDVALVALIFTVFA